METSGLQSYSGQSRESVTASVQAGQQYCRERDIPDVLGWKDLAAQPDATFDALCRRASEGRVPGAVCGFPLPKPGKDDLRRLAHLHPLDDLQLRLLAGRILVGVASCAHVHSFGARLASGPPGWQIEPSNHAWQCLRDVASAHIDSGRYAMLVKCDIRRCYPSISAEIVERALVSQGLDAKRIGPLVELLRGLVLVGAPRGLPIGPEASALIAGLVLGVVDRDLAEAGLAHLRYSDDSFIFVSNGASTAHVYDAYCAALDSLGLEPNSEKYEEHSVADGSAWSAVQDPTVSALRGYPAFFGDERHFVVALDEALGQDQPNWKVVSFCLGSLRYRRSPCALPRIYDCPAVLLNLPRQVGRYVAELSENRPTHHEVDQDWLVEQATADRGDAGLAAQLHACEAASRVRLGKANGQRLEEIIIGSSSCAAQQLPVRAAAAHAWAQSRAYRRRRAEDLAEEFGHYNIRRALIDAIATKCQRSSKSRSFRQKMWSADHDLEPILERLR